MEVNEARKTSRVVYRRPLKGRKPAAERFKLILGMEKSTNFNNFMPFPFTAPQTTVNGQGKIEFLFTSPDNAAFFRLGAE